MIEKDEIKVGLLIWWSAERLTKAWSCPCVVSHIEGNRFKVTSLDDFKEVEDLFLQGPCLREMRKCTINEVKDYFKGSERARQDAVTRKSRELADAEEELRIYKQRVAEFISKHEKTEKHKGGMK